MVSTEAANALGGRRRSLGTAVPGVVSGTNVESRESASTGMSVWYFLQDSQVLESNTESLNCQLIMAATSKKASIGRSVAILLFPLFLCFIQVALLNGFYSAGSWVPCKQNKECRPGEYCDSYKGACLDCIAYNYSSCQDPKKLQDAVDWCSVQDILPSRCDHLVRHADDASNFDKVAIIFLSFLLAGALAGEFDEAVTEQAILHYRAKELKPLHRAVVKFMGWILFRLQAYVIPFYIAGAVTTLVVFGPLVITKVLVDFLAITFILEADNILKHVWVHPGVGGKLKEVVATMNKEGFRIEWFASRLYILGVTIFLITFILGFEGYVVLVVNYYQDAELFKAALNTLETKYGMTPENSIIAPCNGMLSALNLSTLLFSALGGFLHSLYLALGAFNSTSGSGRLYMLLDVILTPLVGAVTWYIMIEIAVTDRGFFEGCAAAVAGAHGH